MVCGKAESRTGVAPSSVSVPLTESEPRSPKVTGAVRRSRLGMESVPSSTVRVPSIVSVLPRANVPPPEMVTVAPLATAASSRIAKVFPSSITTDTGP